MKVDLRKDKKGMTLVETIVALALLSLALFILYLGFSTAGMLFVKGAILKDKGQYTAGVLEGGADTDSKVEAQNETGGVTLHLGDGTTLILNGHYFSAADKENGKVRFYRFDSENYEANRP